MIETVSQELRRFATAELGFDLVGFTGAAPLPGGAHLARWLAGGWHGEMAWMEDAAARADPGCLLPGARSVVCVAMSYHDPVEPPETRPRADRAVVSRYARRRDYHKPIKARLVRLGRWLERRLPGTRWRAATDTAPLLEKELAERAGLGWIGRNTCLINRGLGSELLLGELVTDAPLAGDGPAANHCGDCTACVEACPTAALREPYRLDARRCISYLTIEHRSRLTPAQRRLLGSHLFGCDVCQAVCPWNRKARPGPARPLATRPHLGRLDPARLAPLTEAGWRELAAGTPLRRLDYRRFRRNLEAIGENAATPP